MNKNNSDSFVGVIVMLYVGLGVLFSIGYWMDKSVNIFGYIMTTLTWPFISSVVVGYITSHGITW